MKQVALIYIDNKLVFASEVRDEKSVDFLALKREAETNLKDYFKMFELMQKQLDEQKKEIELLKEQVKVLKGED